MLLAKKRIKVVRTFQVAVQTMTGHSFDVVLESGAAATVGQLKAEIEEVVGTLVHRQDLFVLCAEVEKGSEVPLLDDFVIAEACTDGGVVRSGGTRGVKEFVSRKLTLMF